MWPFDVSHPRFSVVIPTFRRPAQLARLLSSLAALRYPPDRWETIVVNDGGERIPPASLERCPRPPNLRVFGQRRTGPGGARNFGAAAASGEFLAFLDDDCEADAGWLEALARRMDGAGSLICGGRTVNRLRENPYCEATQAVMDSLCETPGAFFTSNNLAIRRDDFHRLGGFDATLLFGEDRDFCHRWALRGGRFATVPNALAYHAHPLDGRGFFELHMRYGAGSARVRAGCGKDGLPAPRVNGPGWYARLLRSGFRERPWLRGVQVSSLIFVSQIAALTGMLRHRTLLPPIGAHRSKAANA